MLAPVDGRQVGERELSIPIMSVHKGHSLGLQRSIYGFHIIAGTIILSIKQMTLRFIIQKILRKSTVSSAVAGWSNGRLENADKPF